MSIAGYFQKRTTELRMSGSPDPTRISYDGPVLTGHKSVEQAQADDQISTLLDPGPRILDCILGRGPQPLIPPTRSGQTRQCPSGLPGKFRRRS